MKKLAITVCWAVIFLIGTMSLILLIAMPFVAMSMFASQLRYQFAVAVANDGRSEDAQTEEPQQDMMAEYFQAPQPVVEPEPSFADVIQAEVAQVRSATAQADRQILAGTFRQAANLLTSTQISSLEELGRFLGVSAQAALGAAFQHWEPFMFSWSQQVSAYSQSGEISDMPALATVCQETADILSGGLAQVMPELDVLAAAKKSRLQPPKAAAAPVNALTTAEAVRRSRTPDTAGQRVPVTFQQQPVQRRRGLIFRRR